MVASQGTSEGKWLTCPECGAKVRREGLWGWLGSLLTGRYEVRCDVCRELGCDQCCDSSITAGPGPVAEGATGLVERWVHKRCRAGKSDV